MKKSNIDMQQPKIYNIEKLIFWIKLVFNQIIHLNKIIPFILKYGTCIYIIEEANIDGNIVKDVMLNINPNINEILEFTNEIKNENKK